MPHLNMKKTPKTEKGEALAGNGKKNARFFLFLIAKGGNLV